MTTLAEPLRPAVQAAIKRASATAQRDMDTLDAQVLTELLRIYRQAAADIEADITAAALSGPTVRLEVLQDLLGQVNTRLSTLEAARNGLLTGNLGAAALLGAGAFAAVGLDVTRIAHEAVQVVQAFTAADGLQLSDRLWRVDRGAREQISRAIESAVIQGHSASRAVEDFLGRGQPVPPDIAAKVGTAAPGGLARASKAALLRDEDGAYAKAERVFRTELNRAHGLAYEAGATDTPGAVGMQFLLSPLHPRPDICLTAGAIITTRTGGKRVEAVEVGEFVLTHAGRFRRVAKTYRRNAAPGPLVRVRFQAGSNRTREVVMTPNHPVLTPAGWTPAGDLQTASPVVACPQAPFGRLDPRGDGEACKASRDFRETEPAPDVRTIGAVLCGGVRRRWSDSFRMRPRGWLRPNHASIPGIEISPPSAILRPTAGSPHQSARGTCVTGLPQADGTCLGAVSHSSGSTLLPSANIRASNISAPYYSFWRRTLSRTSGTLIARWRGRPDNMPTSKKPAAPLRPGVSVHGMSSRTSGMPFQPACRGPSNERNNGDCRIASAWCAFLAPTDSALASGLLRRIRRLTRWVWSRSWRGYSFTADHPIIERTHTGGEPVFNLEVEDDHSYVANGLVVHNCDLHAHANLHGLGPGIYPFGKSPWPAHPNTLSYQVIVFGDEVTAADRAGQETPLDWLTKQPVARQASVLGSRAKQAALQAGVLKANEIRTPWRVLKEVYAKRGVDVAALTQGGE